MENLHISSLNMDKFLRWVVETDTAFLQKAVDVLGTKMESREAEKSTSIFGNPDHSLLCKAERKQARIILRTFKAVQISAASDVHPTQWFFTLFHEKAFPDPLEWKRVSAKRHDQEKR